jgi:hypothetical protein
MSARFNAYFIVLLLATGLTVVTFALPATTADWVSIGAAVT